ncbi:MAG: 6-phosphofructokinase [Limnochordia bacterium]|nr:6-phosphofructokinase [Limnochordia bacterium]MDI9464557.1 6-phosphofructokinase [Bacillota bacterium]HOB39632.1 6-phosphofructokinase [Limnochordia bacterium]HOK30457.1 6-phosphofructokinase [Limnochordia bacterium]HOL99301.1 6-phosphofructokinase [Limnochordia bacterium]
MAKRVGILTSGGDAPGMNAAIRTAVRSALHFNLEPWGIYRGYHGLINGELEPMDSRAVSGIIQRGGTILKSARSEHFKTPEGRAQAVDMLRRHEIDSLLVIGGDGSLRGALSLQQEGITVVGIPATIDNDIPCTDYSIGFDTAVNTVMDAVNKIRDTASSHDRVYLVEVMGRHSGHIALYSGLACGADVILIPEVPYDLDQVCQQIQKAAQAGKTYNIIVVAEGVRRIGGGNGTTSPAMQIGRYIEEKAGIETRITILGHIQRGGVPTVRDRLLASRLAYHAIELIFRGVGGKMVGEVDQVVKAFDLDYALAQEKQLNPDYRRLAAVLASL